MEILSDNQAIQLKIRELFAYRKLTDLFRVVGLTYNRKFITDLYTLQHRIYGLDTFLESTWVLDKGRLKEHWTEIQAALDPFGISDKDKKKWLKEIVQYERIEKRCRKGKWPCDVSADAFYTTKSCDVHLIRKLLYRAYPQLVDAYPFVAWSFYDLITEVNDDITDVYEDLPTYNANRFIVCILRQGHLKTRSEYYRFLANISHRAYEYFQSCYMAGERSQLFEWTAERAVETTNLLESTIRDLDMAKISSSLILTRMT